MRPRLLPIVAPGYRQESLIDTIKRLGLTTGLKVCLDAGDRNSWNSVVDATKWRDTSGNGYDFFLGIDGATAASMPTFNGTIGGLSSREYWSFDGGDYFRYDTTNETWMNNLHKAAAVCTVLWALFPESAPHRTVGTAQNTSDVGVLIALNATTDAVNYTGNKGDGVTAGTHAGSFAIANSGWQIAATTLREGVTNGSNAFHNGVFSPDATFSFTTPSSSAATRTMEIAASGNAFGPYPSTSRLAWIAIWEGTALTQPQIGRIWKAQRGRFSI